jgi:putative phage-type endonuclease
VEHPSTVKQWSDDMKLWPPLEFGDIYIYLIESKACDKEQMKCYKSLEGHVYLSNGWVSTVFHSKPQSELHFLKAYVRPSQSVNDKEHCAWVCVDSSGCVKAGGCSCVAGKGETCSHVAAVLFKVEMAHRLGLSGSACTDNSNLWNKGTKRNVEPVRLSGMKIKKSQLFDGVTVSARTEAITSKIFPHPLDSEKLQEFVANSSVKDLFFAEGTLIKKIITTEVVHQAQHASQRQHGEHSNSLSCSICTRFFNKYIKLSASNRKAIEVRTRNQDNSLWKETRRLRITASTACKIPKRPTTKPDKFIDNHVYSTFQGTAATKHGTDCEPLARKYFEHEYNKVVGRSGVVICCHNFWLCASPDGLVDEDAIIEIKCPFRQCIKDLVVSNKYDVKEDVNGNNYVDPRGKNGYYTQVQLTMYCTQRMLCYFVVWSESDAIIVHVPYDNEFVQNVLPQLEQFYFKSLLPRLVDDFDKGLLVFDSSYKSSA